MYVCGSLYQATFYLQYVFALAPFCTLYMQQIDAMADHQYLLCWLGLEVIQMVQVTLYLWSIVGSVVK